MWAMQVKCRRCNMCGTHQYFLRMKQPAGNQEKSTEIAHAFSNVQQPRDFRTVPRGRRFWSVVATTVVELVVVTEQMISSVPLHGSLEPSGTDYLLGRGPLRISGKRNWSSTTQTAALLRIWINLWISVRIRVQQFDAMCKVPLRSISIWNALSEALLPFSTSMKD